LVTGWHEDFRFFEEDQYELAFFVQRKNESRGRAASC